VCDAVVLGKPLRQGTLLRRLIDAASGSARVQLLCLLTDVGLWEKDGSTRQRGAHARLNTLSNTAGEGDVEQSQGGGRRRRAAADADPNSTLESSFEALNVKKFDLAFAVDPLFHKTSAQFDEGGASGELLSDLLL